MVIEGDFRLTEGEQLKLLQTDQALQFVQTCFLYQSDEAFVSLCMLLCLGKDFCSPSKKNQRAARIDLFETVAINSGRAKNKAHKYRLSYRDLAKGFSKLSDRWHLFARDELLSLAILIDAQQGRLIDRDAFLTFVAMVFDEYKRDMPHQKTIFRSIFNNLREGLYSLYITEENKVVAQKLALLAVKARSMKMEPMRMLLHAIQSKESAAEVVVFVEALVESCSGRDHDGHGEIEDSFESAQGDYESHPKQSDDSTTYGERVVIEDMTEDSSALQIGDLYTSKQATNVASDIVEGNKSAQENIMQVVQFLGTGIQEIVKELLENRLGNVEGYALLSEMEIKITSARISYASLMQERVNQKENNAYEQTRQPPQVDVLGCNSIELGIGFNENSPHSEAKLQPEQVGTPLADQTPKFFPQVAGGTTVNQLAELNRRQQEVMQHALAEKQKEALHNRIMMASQNALQSNSPNRNAGSGNKRSTGISGKANSRLSAGSLSGAKVVRANMDIFKSPAKIQIHGNKNKYNQEKYEWTPRVLSNKYNQRFQTTADLRAREKSNGFLYGK